MYDVIVTVIPIIIIVSDVQLSVKMRITLHKVLHDATVKTKFTGLNCDFP
jgi:hypothetical protein